jgi:predicted dehydrogenase
MELAAVVDTLPKEKLSPKGGNIKTESISWDQLAHVPFFQSLQDALAHVEADAVLVATPNFLHCGDVLTALDAGKDVFVEKPLCMTLEEARIIQKKAIETGRIIQVGYVVRFTQPYRYLKETLESGKLGALQYLQMNRVTGAPAWWNGVDEAVKLNTALQDLNIHDIDFALSLLGTPESVRLNRDIQQNFGTSILSSTWKFKGNIPVQISGGFLRPSTVPFRAGFMAMFEKGMMEFSKQYAHSTLHLHTPEESTEIPLDENENPFLLELLSFRDCVLAGIQPECGVQAAVLDMEWLDRMVR